MTIDPARATQAPGARTPAPAAPPAEPQAPADSVTLSNASPPQGQNTPPIQPPSNPTTNPISREEMVRLSGELAAMGRDLRPGDRIVVRMEGQTVAEVVKEGPDRWKSFKNMVGDTAQSVVSAANSAIQEDPSFTFREAIEVARSRVLKTDLEGLKEVTLKGLVPAARGIALMLDIYRARQTWKNEEANFIDKFIDGGHVVTDIAGVIGSLPQLLPALQAVPGIQGFLMAAVVGDIVAFGYHFLRWFQKTGNRPFPIDPGDKQGKDPNKDPNQPQPTPAPDPKQPQVRVSLGGVTTVTPAMHTVQMLRARAAV